MMSFHVDSVDLVGYVRGRLGSRQAARVRVHCVECVDCGDQLAAVMLLRSGLGSSAPVSSVRWGPVLAVAAGVFLAVGAGVFAWRSPTLAPGTAVSAAPPPIPTVVLESPGETAAAAAERRLGVLAQLIARHDRTRVAPTASRPADLGGILGEASQIYARGDLDQLVTFLQQFDYQYDSAATPLKALALLATGGDAEPAMSAVAQHVLRLPWPAVDGTAAGEFADVLSFAEEAASLTVADWLLSEGAVWKARLLVMRVALEEGRFAYEAQERLLTR